MVIAYSTSQKARLAAIGKQYGLSGAEVGKLVEYDFAHTGNTNVDDGLDYWNAHPEGVQQRLVQYNADNPKAMLMTITQQYKHLALLVAAVVVALTIGFVAWKKLKK